MDLTGFQLIAETDAAFCLRSPDGEEFLIAKGGLLLNTADSIKQHFAKGGEVQSENSASNGYARGGMFDDFDPSDLQLQSPSMLAQRGPASPGMADPASPASRMSDSEAITNSFADQSNAIWGKADAEARLGQAQAATQEWLARRQMELRDEHLARFNGWQARGAQLRTSIMNAEIDPDRIWADSGTGGKIAAAIGMILGGLGSALQGGGPNMGYESLNRAIERDILAQKEQIGRLQTSYSMHLQEGATEEEAYKLAKADTMDMASAIAQANAAKFAAPIAQENAAFMVADLQRKAAESRVEAGSQSLEDQLKRSQIEGGRFQREYLQAQAKHWSQTGRTQERQMNVQERRLGLDEAEAEEESRRRGRRLRLDERRTTATERQAGVAEKTAGIAERKLGLDEATAEAEARVRGRRLDIDERGAGTSERQVAISEKTAEVAARRLALDEAKAKSEALRQGKGAKLDERKITASERQVSIAEKEVTTAEQRLQFEIDKDKEERRKRGGGKRQPAAGPGAGGSEIVPGYRPGKLPSFSDGGMVGYARGGEVDDEEEDEASGPISALSGMKSFEMKEVTDIREEIEQIAQISDALAGLADVIRTVDEAGGPGSGGPGSDLPGSGGWRMGIGSTLKDIGGKGALAAAGGGAAIGGGLGAAGGVGVGAVPGALIGGGVGLAVGSTLPYLGKSLQTPDTVEGVKIQQYADQLAHIIVGTGVKGAASEGDVERAKTAYGLDLTKPNADEALRNGVMALRRNLGVRTRLIEASNPSMYQYYVETTGDNFYMKLRDMYQPTGAKAMPQPTAASRVKDFLLSTSPVLQGARAAKSLITKGNK